MHLFWAARNTTWDSPRSAIHTGYQTNALCLLLPLFDIPRSEVCMGIPAFLIPSMFSFMSYTVPSFPSPCGRLSRLGILWNDLTSSTHRTFLVLFKNPTCMGRKRKGISSFWRFSFYVPSSLTPDRTSNISPFVQCQSMLYNNALSIPLHRLPLP